LLRGSDPVTTPTSRRKLLIISIWESRWSLGGAAGVSDDVHFIEGFTRNGWELHFLAPEGAEESNAEFRGVVTHTYPNFFRRTARRSNAFKRVYWPYEFNRVVAPRALQIARDVRPDLILGHTHYSARTTYTCRRKLGIPTAVKLFGVMHLVRTDWPRHKYLFKNWEQLRALRYPQDAWIVLDDGTRGDVILAARGVPPERIHFLPNGLNVEWRDLKFNRPEVRFRYGMKDDAVVVLFLARMVASKRPRDVVRAVPRVHKSTDGEIQFVFAGHGPERAACEELASQLGVDDIVSFLGVVPHADVPAVMSAADVFVTTSELTNMAIPTCEALVCGVPVVAYDVGDTAKVVVPDETGVLVENGNPSRLADALAALINEPKKRARLGQNARKFARDNFTSWEDRIRAEMTIIEGLIENRPSNKATAG
jgi:glycosyltransferase involved in cell wall biosynthesis